MLVHSITGCDTVSRLCNIGKGTALKVLQSGKIMLSVGKIDGCASAIIQDSTQFISACYGQATSSPTMFNTRFHVWSAKVSNPKASSAPQLRALPPTTEAFEQHAIRGHYQSLVWTPALLAVPLLLIQQNLVG